MLYGFKNLFVHDKSRKMEQNHEMEEIELAGTPDEITIKHTSKEIAEELEVRENTRGRTKTTILGLA